LVAASADLSKTMQSLKSFTARCLIESISKKQMDWLLNQLAYHKAKHKKESAYQVWQEGFHPQEILSADMLRQKIVYLHENPVRRGYVERPEHWRYSSAGHCC
jgi:putative transposase